MVFDPKNWQNKPSAATPLDAESQRDQEVRLSNYTDDRVATRLPFSNNPADEGKVPDAFTGLPRSLTPGSVMLPEPRADGVADDIGAINTLIASSPAGTHFIKPRPDVPYVAAQPIQLQPGRSYDFRCPPWPSTGLEPAASGIAGAAVRMAAGANLDHLVVTPAVLGTGASPGSNGPIQLINLLIDGNRLAQTGGKGLGLNVACWGSDFANITVVNARGHAIAQARENAGGQLFSSSNGNGYENRWGGLIKVSNCGGHGFYSGPAWTDCTLEGQFTASYIGLTGINIDRGAGWNLGGNIHLWVIGTDGVRMTGGYAATMADIYIEGFGARVTPAESAAANGKLPWTYVTYAAGTAYNMYDVVVSSGVMYYSLVDSNLGNTPASNPSQWSTINPGATAVYGIAGWALGQDRHLDVHGCKVSIGHTSIATIAGINYRAYILQGPSAGAGYVKFHDNVAGNEFANGQAATAMAYRIQKQAGALNIGGMNIAGSGAPTNHKIGTFSQADSIDAGVAAWAAV